MVHSDLCDHHAAHLPYTHPCDTYTQSPSLFVSGRAQPSARFRRASRVVVYRLASRTAVGLVSHTACSLVTHPLTHLILIDSPHRHHTMLQRSDVWAGTQEPEARSPSPASRGPQTSEPSPIVRSASSPHVVCDALVVTAVSFDIDIDLILLLRLSQALSCPCLHLSPFALRPPFAHPPSTAFLVLPPQPSAIMCGVPSVCSGE